MPKRRKRVKRILNVVPSRDTDRDWRLADADAAGVVDARAGAIPPRKDLRAAWWKVGDQGETGSCVGWASADGVLRWHFVNDKRLKTTERLSPRFQWMASKETDDSTTQPTTFIESAGTSIKTALDVARKFGSVPESVLTFDGRLYPGETKTFYAIASQHKITSYFNLSLAAGHKLEDWRKWIATSGPILCRLGVDRTWDNADQTGGDMDEYLPNTIRGGHAVALVGYTPDRFIVRNSWGTAWGDKGFGYASLAYAQAAFTEAYGVAS
jgi:hypothetical protein